jgi:hypothetical protein
MKKRKPKVSETEGYGVIELSELERILSIYRLWSSLYPHTWNFQKSEANKPEFWARAQTMCREFGLAPELLLYVVHHYINACVLDAEVRRFDPMLFRAPRLMQRSVFNFKVHLERELTGQRDLHYLMYGNEYIPSRGVHEDLMKVAQMGPALLFYFMQFKELERTYEKRPPLTPEESDQIAYEFCDRNPFALLFVAKTPRLVALAEVNCFYLNQRCPWHQTVWEGRMPGNRNLTDLRTTCLADPRPYWYGGNLGETWPDEPFTGRPYEKNPVGDSEPRLKLTVAVYDSKLDSYLQITANQARTRAGAPPSGA